MNNRFNALSKATGRKPIVSESGRRVKDYFALDVFTRERMKEYISDTVLEQLFDNIDNGKTISRDIANSVAIGMRKWAMEHGATHYTHWFQPLTGGTAEKHDAFFDLQRDGTLIEIPTHLASRLAQRSSRTNKRSLIVQCFTGICDENSRNT